MRLTAICFSEEGAATVRQLMKSMKGFKEMCGYLLDRHSAGELVASAISKNCAATLKKYSQEK